MKRIFVFLVSLIFIISLTACGFPKNTPSAEGFPYDSLYKETVSDRDESVPLTVGGEELELLLDSISLPKTYTWTSTVTYKSDGYETSYMIVKQVNGTSIRCDKYSSKNSLLLYSIYKNGTLYVIDNLTNESYKKEGFDAGFLGSIVNLSDPVLLLRTGNDTNISDVTLGYKNSEAVINFTYTDDAYGFKEEYSIRMSDGIPISVESTLNGETSYTLSTSEVTYEISDDSIFNVPKFVK